MVKSRTAKKPLECCTIRNNGKVVKVGDSVLMRAPKPHQPYVGRVEKLESNARKNVNVVVRWYYRPEESKRGRRKFHGAKELFLSDHYDTQNVNTIEDTCVVHSFKNYTKLDRVASQDYFCRFEYTASTGDFNPQSLPVHCICEMPYNPDDFMLQCEACKYWYHHECLHLSIEEAAALKNFLCFKCTNSDKKNAGTSVNDFVSKTSPRQSDERGEAPCGR